MADLGTLYATLGVKTDSLIKGKQAMWDFTKSAEKNMGQATRATSTLASTFAKLGIAISGALVVRKLVQFGTQGVKAFGDLTQSIANASTLFGGIDVDIDNLTGRIRALSNESGIAADAIGLSLYNSLSAGVTVTEDMGVATDFLERSMKLSKAGFTDMDTAVDATIKTLNAYGLGFEEVDRIQKILIQTQNKGIATVGQQGAYLAQVTPVAAQFGVSFENVGAAISTMTAQGVRARNTMTQLAALFLELGKAGGAGAIALDKAARSAGWSTGNFTELMKSGKSLGEVLNVLNDYAESTNTSLLDLFGSAEAGKAAALMTGESAGRMSEAFQAMTTDADVLQTSYEQVMNTMVNKTQVLSTRMTNLKGLLGEALAPSITTVVDKFNDWITANEDLIAQKMDTLADNLAKAFEWTATHLDKIVFLIKGLVGVKIVTWMTAASISAYGFATALTVATTAARALGRALIVGAVVEGITWLFTSLSTLNKVVGATPLTWKQAAVVSVDKFVNTIVNGIEALAQLIPNLMMTITDPIIDGLGAIFTAKSMGLIFTGQMKEVGAIVKNAATASLDNAWTRVALDFESTMKKRPIKIASDLDMMAWDLSKNMYFSPIEPPEMIDEPTGLVTPVIPDLITDPAEGFGDLEATSKSHLDSLTAMYKGFQDDLSLMDFTGWEQRREEVKLWGRNMEEELKAAGVWNDEFKTLIGNITDTQNLIIDAEKGLEDANALKKRAEYTAELTKEVTRLSNETEAMAKGPKAFEEYLSTAGIASQVADVRKEMVELGYSSEWIERNLPVYEKWVRAQAEGQEQLAKHVLIQQTIERVTLDSFTSMFGAMLDGLMDAEKGWKEFGNVVLDIIKQIATEMAIMMIIKPMASGISDGISGWFTKSAKGNAFDSSGVVPFAKGGTFGGGSVVSQPTIFPFAKGTGLMGEAGPEAILPLKRIGGNLGVIATGVGGGGDVVVNVINRGAPVEVEQQSSRKGINGEAIIDVTIKQSLDRLDGKGALDGMFQRHGAHRGGGR